MSAVFMLIVGIPLGFLMPWPRTLLFALLVPLYYLGVYLSLWGSGLGDQWIWSMVLLMAFAFAAIAVGIMLGGGTRLLDRRVGS